MISGKELEEIQEKIKDAKNVILITEQYSQSALAGDNYKKIDNIIDYVHEQGNKIVCISCYLPYDVARLQKADSILLAYSAKGMNEKPNFENDSVATYGVSIPCSIYTAFDENAKLGKLPINIPTLDNEYNYTSNYLYKRNYGLQYDIVKEEVSNGQIETNSTITKSEDINEDISEKQEINENINEEKTNIMPNESKKETSVTKNNNPKTGDNIIVYIVIFIIALIGIIILIVIFAKKYLGKKHKENK